MKMLEVSENATNRDGKPFQKNNDTEYVDFAEFLADMIKIRVAGAEAPSIEEGRKTIRVLDVLEGEHNGTVSLEDADFEHLKKKAEFLLPHLVGSVEAVGIYDRICSVSDAR